MMMMMMMMMMMIMMMMAMMMNCFSSRLTDERRLALFPAGITVRDPHHGDTLREGLEPAQNLSSGLVE